MTDRSTIPSPEGPTAPTSRAGALHRALCDSPAVPESFELVRGRVHDWFLALKPRDEFHAWLVDQVALLTIRIDRTERVERRLRDRHSLRAELTWEADRRRDAETLGSGLARRPGEVVEALRRTPQGCDWLIRRWALLAEAADARGAWTPEQSALASDLLGTPAEFRGEHGPVLPAPGGPAALARLQLDGLRADRESAVLIDEADRALAMADLSDEGNVELRRLRRYESGLHGRLRWCLGQLRYQSPHPGPAPGIHPTRVERPEAPAPPEPAPAVKTLINPHPPIDLDPSEDPGPGKVADIPAILSARRERAARKAEARRESRRRKLERLRC